jgi:Fe-S cluster assembly ATP-binding protein
LSKGEEVRGLLEPQLLFVKGIEVEREGNPILRGISMQVKPGEICGVLGRNGAGKSSLAYAIMGLPQYAPKAGRVWFNGQDITDWSVTERARAGITLAWQHPARYEGIPVRDYLRLSNPEAGENALSEALKLVQMESHYLDRLVDKGLSGGERKRIELSSIYLMKPKLAILDEPDSGVDLLALGEVMGLFKILATGGSSVLIITHREDVAAACDRSYLMCAGKMILEGSAEAVKRYFLSQCEPCLELEPSKAGEVAASHA